MPEIEARDDDDAVMSLVEHALARPAGERQTYLQNACAGDPDLYQEVMSYVEWETRMNGFLLEPLYSVRAMEHPFEPGELLEQRFRIVREVAQGGMGVVYEAVDERLKRRIALKCAKAGFGNRLPPEVRHATEISHPNVCKIFEIHTATTRLGEIDFVTMEFLTGETLTERLARGPVPEAEAVAIARQLSAGLAEAHRNHVIHGDLKSNNVILTSGADGANRAVIMDFGLARGTEAAQPTAHSGVSAGTPAYMAPELWNGAKASVASDIFALGVILHELVYGRRPQSPEGAPDRQPKWDRILARCLDPDPLRRFGDADEIAQDLAPSRVLHWWLAAAAAVALAALAGAITYRSATAPEESVSMALLPIAASGHAAALAGTVARDEEAELRHLQGGKRVRLKVISAAEVARRHVDSAAAARTELGATHVLQATLAEENGRVVLHALLTDTRTQANAGDREFQYAPGEVRYAAAAMAGMVTAALRLPPPAGAPVNAAAKKDYEAGLAYTRRNSTVDKALPLLERAVAADPDSPLTWAGLAEAQWFQYYITKDQGWLDRTSESLRQAQERNLDLAPVHRAAGLPLANAGHYEQAEAEYLRAIDLEPANGDAYRRLGQVYDNSGRLDEALAAFQKAVEREPGYFKTYQDLGSYYSRRGDSREAARQFEKCVQLAPDEPDAHYVLGTVYLDLGKYLDGERELRVAVALGETPVALHNLAYALMYQKRDQDAIPYLERALRRFPDRYLWWMLLGDAYRRTHLPADSSRAYGRGLELAEREMARNPRDGLVRSRLAYLCARLGDRERAQSEIAQARELSPDSSAARGMAVWTYEALGKREETLAVLRSSPGEVLVDAGRWPDLAGLRKDSRFQQLLALIPVQ